MDNVVRKNTDRLQDKRNYMDAARKTVLTSIVLPRPPVPKDSDIVHIVTIGRVVAIGSVLL